jgi:hypothetical protein
MSIVQTSRIQTLRYSVRTNVGPRMMFLILSHRQEVRVRARERCDAHVPGESELPVPITSTDSWR